MIDETPVLLKPRTRCVGRINQSKRRFAMIFQRQDHRPDKCRILRPRRGLNRVIRGFIPGITPAHHLHTMICPDLKFSPDQAANAGAGMDMTPCTGMGWKTDLIEPQKRMFRIPGKPLTHDRAVGLRRRCPGYREMQQFGMGPFCPDGTCAAYPLTDLYRGVIHADMSGAKPDGMMPRSRNQGGFGCQVTAIEADPVLIHPFTLC